MGASAGGGGCWLPGGGGNCTERNESRESQDVLLMLDSTIMPRRTYYTRDGGHPITERHKYITLGVLIDFFDSNS